MFFPTVSGPEQYVLPSLELVRVGEAFSIVLFFGGIAPQIGRRNCDVYL